LKKLWVLWLLLLLVSTGLRLQGNRAKQHQSKRKSKGKGLHWLKPLRTGERTNMPLFIG
jgi:hypothetical protein